MMSVLVVLDFSVKIWITVFLSVASKIDTSFFLMCHIENIFKFTAEILVKINILCHCNKQRTYIYYHE